MPFAVDLKVESIGIDQPGRMLPSGRGSTVVRAGILTDLENARRNAGSPSSHVESRKPDRRNTTKTSRDSRAKNAARRMRRDQKRARLSLTLEG